MSVLVDTGVFYAHADTDATRHGAAVRAFDALVDDALGQPYTSDYVFDEAVTLTLSRTGNFDEARTVGRRIRGIDPFPRFVQLAQVTRPLFETAVELFECYEY
jgi:predicted nucleic acid-binding protein